MSLKYKFYQNYRTWRIILLLFIGKSRKNLISSEKISNQIYQNNEKFVKKFCVRKR